MCNYKNNKGFTLIELSIVLVIIGILISASLKLVGPISQLVKLRETKESIDSTIQSVISWASSHNSLPNNDEFHKIAKSPNDPWGLPYAFLYYSSLSRTTPTKDTICGRRTTPLMVYTNYTSPGIAFAVISRADSPIFKSKINGARVTSSAPSPAGMIDARGINSDIIRWVTIDELRGKIGCQRAPLNIITPQNLKANSGDAFFIKADGGVPFILPSPHPFEWCVKVDLTTPPLPEANFTPNPIFQSSCDSTNNSLWVPSSNLKLSVSTSGTYSFTVYVRDNDNNFVQQHFSLTVSP